MTSRDYDVILVTSQTSKSSHSETRTRTNYPCGPCKRTLKKNMNIVLKRERIRITTDCRRRSISHDRTPAEIRHLFMTKALCSDSKALKDLHCYPFSQRIQNQKLDRSTNSDNFETNLYKLIILLNKPIFGYTVCWFSRLKFYWRLIITALCNNLEHRRFTR